jgi:molybdenum cofactor cytidylyltransferase
LTSDPDKNMLAASPVPLSTVGILLAGGFSRRFGPQNKLTHRLPDGEMIGMRAAKTLIATLPDAIAVVSGNETAFTEGLAAMGYRVVCCHMQHAVMADSLKLGILSAQSAFPHMTGLVIALADMPYIQAETIRQVTAGLARASIVQPVMQGQPGHPVAFASRLIPELLAIEGDQGAREVLRAHQADILRLECQDPGILKDIDTPADLG